MTLHFVHLGCPACGSAMHGNRYDILFVCGHCGSGAMITGDALEVVETTALLPVPSRPTTTWRPAWALDTEVLVDQRWVAGGKPGGAVRRDRRFIIPAFDVPFRDLTKLSQALIAADAALTEVPREPIRGGTLSLSDAETIIRHLVIGEEVHRPDILATVNVKIAVRSHRLAALPFADGGSGRLICSITGATITDESN